MLDEKIVKAHQKMGYKPTRIEEQVISTIKSFITQTENLQTFVTPEVSYNMREVIKKCRRNYYGIFEDSAVDHLGQEKIWSHITQSIVEAEVKNTDVDPKDVDTESDVPSKNGIAALIRVLLRRWMRQAEFGGEMDDDLRNRAIDGHIIRKAVEKYDTELKQSMISTREVDLLRVFIDGNAKSLHSSPFAEQAILSVPEIMRDYKSWINLKYLQGKSQVRNFSTDWTQTNYASPVPMAEIYEYHADIPTWWVDGKEDSWDGSYKLGMVIMSNIYDSPVVHKVMFNMKGRKPYEESRLIKVPNRYIGMGRAEQIFGYQLYFNILFNTRRVNQLLSANQLFTFRKGVGITAQMLAKIMTGGAIPRIDADDVTRLDTRDYSFMDSINEQRSLTDDVQRLTDQNDVALGGQLPSSTPATIGVLQERSQGRGSELKKESFGRYLENLFNRHIIPSLKKNLKKGDVLSIKEDPSLLRKLDECMVNYYVNTELLKEYEQGNYIMPEQIEMEKQRLTQMFASMGQQRWTEIMDEYLDTNEVAVTVNVSEEFTDKNAKMKALQDFIFGVSKAFPEYDVSDGLNAMVDLLELPIELKLKTQQTMQSQMQAPNAGQIQGQKPMQPQGMLQGQPQAPMESTVMQRANQMAQ